MPAYRLRGAVRAPDGAIGDPLIDEIITAADRQEAVRLANARESLPEDEPVNALWLVDEGGNLIWSLRRAAPSGRVDVRDLGTGDPCTET